MNDADSGLAYMQARYYDPDAGRFLSIDEMTADPGKVLRLSRYSYADSNPTNQVDEDGMGPSDPPVTAQPIPAGAPAIPIIVTATVRREIGISIFEALPYVLPIALMIADSNSVHDFFVPSTTCYGGCACVGVTGSACTLTMSMKGKKVPVPGLNGKEKASDVPPACGKGVAAFTAVVLSILKSPSS